MNFNNTIIEKSDFFSLLICKNNLINFYKKNNWIKVNKKDFKILDHSFDMNIMLFNAKKFIKMLFLIISSNIVLKCLKIKLTEVFKVFYSSPQLSLESKA